MQPHEVKHIERFIGRPKAAVAITFKSNPDETSHTFYARLDEIHYLYTRGLGHHPSTWKTAGIVLYDLNMDSDVFSRVIEEAFEISLTLQMPGALGFVFKTAQAYAYEFSVDEDDVQLAKLEIQARHGE